MKRASLLYRDTCAKCRVLAKVALALSLGFVRLIPFSSDEGQDFSEAASPQGITKIVLKLGATSIKGTPAVLLLPCPFFLAVAAIALLHLLLRS